MAAATITIKLRGKLGQEALIDAEDYERVKNYSWYLDKRYVRAGMFDSWQSGKQKTKMFSLHRLIMDAPTGTEVDHINGDKLDNRKSNLRLCSRAENAANLNYAKVAHSGFRGVRKPGRSAVWRVCIRVGNKIIDFGGYKDKKEAAYIHDRVVMQIHGEFANLNFKGAY